MGGIRVLAGGVVRRVGPRRGRVTCGVAAALGLSRALPAGGVVEVERVGRDRVAAVRAATGRRLGPGRRRVGVHHEGRDPHGRPGSSSGHRDERHRDDHALGVLLALAEQQWAVLVAPGDIAVEGADGRPPTGADGKIVRPRLHLGRRARAGGEYQRLGQVGAHREVASGHLVAGVPWVARGQGRGGQGKLLVRESGEAVDLGLGLLYGDLLLLRPHRGAPGGTEHPHRRSDPDRHQRDGDQDLDQREAILPPHGRRAGLGFRPDSALHLHWYQEMLRPGRRCEEAGGVQVNR